MNLNFQYILTASYINAAQVASRAPIVKTCGKARSTVASDAFEWSG